MNPGQHPTAIADLTHDEGDMGASIDQALVRVRTEVSEWRGDRRLGDSLHEHLEVTSVLDQVGDRDQLHPVLSRDPDQLGHAGHRAVLIHDLADHACRKHARHGGQVDRRLGVARTAQYSPVPRAQREDVPRLLEVARLDICGGHRLRGDRPVVSTRARRGALPEVDRHRERGLTAVGRVGHHLWDTELVESPRRARETDDAPASA